MPIALLNKAVVILAIRAGSREALPPLFTPPLAMPVNELASRVWMPLVYPEGNVCIQVFHTHYGYALPLVPLRSSRAPQGGHISAIYGVYEVSGSLIATMRYGVNLFSPGSGLTPGTCANRDE